MIWALKRLRWSAFKKSKVIFSLLSFLMGYLFHYMLQLLRTDNKEILNKDFSSDVEKYGDIDVLLVILIFSSVNNFNRRQTIRETWLSGISSNTDVRHYFIISKGNTAPDQNILISVEQEKHKDLLIFPNLEDSFFLLTPKLVASFGWISDTPVLGEQGKSSTKKDFRNFKFVLKCDDDSFVRIVEIINELKTVFSGSKGENLYWGFFDGRARVKKNNQYREDKWDICDFYIPYALGGGYVLAEPMVRFIARSEKYLKKYNNEDVSVGAWLGSYAGINRVHDPRFDTEYISRGCHQTYLITHKHSEVAIRNFHNNLKNTGHLCQKEYKTRMSYVYNWQAVPSKCCARVNPNIP